MNTEQIPREQQTRDSEPTAVVAGDEPVWFQISAYLQVMCLQVAESVVDRRSRRVVVGRGPPVCSGRGYMVARRLLRRVGVGGGGDVRAIIAPGHPRCVHRGVNGGGLRGVNVIVSITSTCRTRSCLSTSGT